MQILSKIHRLLRRPSRRRPRSKSMLWAAACLLGIITVGLLRPSSPSMSSPSVSEGTLQPARNLVERARVVASGPSAPPGFFYVIPTGIHSEEQLAKVLATDPPVAKHYADFDLQKIRFVRLQHNREAYVSYRLGNHIYWTSRKIPLFAGETLVTDGTHYARARCGNRISEVPRQPTSPWQPPEPSLSLPILHPNPVLPALPPLTSVSVQPWPIDTGTGSSGDFPFFPVFFIPPPGGSGGIPDWPPQPDAPLPTPEPSTFVLLSSGLAVLGLGYFFKFRGR